MSTSTETNVELLLTDPSEVARLVAQQLGKLLARDTTGEELVYSPLARHSYYRDLLAVQTGRIASDGASDRLQRHAEQMDRMRGEREALAWQRLRDSGLEYRVTPDRTDGTGGYFSPPAWLNQLFATANRPGRVLAGLMPRFPLPPGVSSINLPVIGRGTSSQTAEDDTPVMEQDFTDSAASSTVVPLAGQADVALQLLEQSPAGAHLDWAIFMDLSEATDAQLETQLLVGTGGSNPATAQLLGITTVPGIVSIPYTDSSPKGSAMWGSLSQVPAQISNRRQLDAECWLMRGSRWFWLQAQEDTGFRPFGLSTRFYLGSDDNTPDPISGLMGLPVFLDNAIPNTLGGTGGLTVGAGSQDAIIAVRPRDMILLEGAPQMGEFREPISGTLGLRLRSHLNVAALTGRRPAGIGALQGTGMTIQTGY